MCRIITDFRFNIISIITAGTGSFCKRGKEKTSGMQTVQPLGRRFPPLDLHSVHIISVDPVSSPISPILYQECKWSCTSHHHIKWGPLHIQLGMAVMFSVAILACPLSGVRLIQMTKHTDKRMMLLQLNDLRRVLSIIPNMGMQQIVKGQPGVPAIQNRRSKTPPCPHSHP